MTRRYLPVTLRGRTGGLTDFVTNVRRLGRMWFFEKVPKSASITYNASGACTDMADPDDEAVRAAVTAFRQIYRSSQPTRH
jgi:GH25 family lysozyme M1 (1,4-beta-N-acetylmuramidase)